MWPAWRTHPAPPPLLPVQPLQDRDRLEALRALGAAGAVQQLIAAGCGLGRQLRDAPALVQLGDELAVVAEGRVARVLKVRPPCLCVRLALC